ncbi:MAG: tRNA epoxyqueuosine(34) reductase QueG [Flavobacteriales bacterium]|nr:tRNA epoxyqueuosine(34) reductase QueG [Flavobacteriales bacterium]
MLSASLKYADLIKSEAKRLGFSFCGFSKAEFLEDEAKPLENWLNKKMHGEMAYMANHFDKRLDPRLLVPGAKTVVSLLYNYFPHQEIREEQDGLKISKYAYGEDYHHVVKDKLKALSVFMQEEIGEVNGRAFVDSAPVLDKAWAKRAGLGWIGKNTNLINKGHGSFFFIAEVIIDLELPPDGPVKDHCGTCTACIDACPTEAIVSPYVVDGSKCISYFTIELKKEIPSEYQSKLDQWVFGCDVCQDVCPWNRFSKPHAEPLFAVKNELIGQSAAEWLDMTEDVFDDLARKSPISRTGLEGMKRNILAATGQL